MSDNEIEKKYLEVAEEVYDLLPGNFVVAYFRMEVTDDVWNGGLFYSVSDGQYRYINRNIEGVQEKVRCIRESLIKGGQEPFSSATFKLKNTGKFHFDFGYEDVSDFGQASERRKNWIKEYLGEDIKIDWA